MRLVAFVAGCIFAASSGGAAHADIPTNDAAQLDQHTTTSNTEIKLVPVTTDHAKARSGIHCASTTGQKGAVKNTAVAPNSATGAAAVNSSAPSFPTAMQSGTSGAPLGEQYDGSQTAAVAAGVAGGQQSATGGNSNYASQTSQVGNSPTVMAAWDANSSARTQNGITFDSVIETASLIAQAYNLANMASVEQMSQAGGTLGYSPVQPVWPRCRAGTAGQGTLASPCVKTASTCSVVSSSCVESRYIDSYGNVIYYLAAAQSGFAAASASPLRK